MVSVFMCKKLDKSGYNENMDNYVGQGMITTSFYLFDAAQKTAIAEMDNRHTLFLAAGDRAGLLALAEEYHELGAVQTAAQIRNEAGHG